MEQADYLLMHNILKVLTNKTKLICAKFNEQKEFKAHAISNKNITFKVIQNRKSHIKEKNKISYVLMNKNEIMVRVDINGKPHNGIKKSHLHIYDEIHQNGSIAIPLDELPNYDKNEELVSSFIEFLKYNYIDTKNLSFEGTLDI